MSDDKNKQNTAKSKLGTKKDPNAEISPWLDYHGKNKKGGQKPPKIGKQLSSLQRIRRRNILLKLGLLLGTSFLIVVGLAYYLSPISLVKEVKVENNGDITSQEIIKSSKITTSDHVVAQLLGKNKISAEIKKQYPSIKKVQVQVDFPNTIKLKLTENKTVAYLKVGEVYHKILKNGDISTESLKQNELKEIPIFLGFQKTDHLDADLKAFKSIKMGIRKQIKFINERMAKPNQIVFVMTDGNVIIGDKRTIGDKIKYYSEIKKTLKVESIIDLEIGAFSKPLSEADKKSYNS